MIGGAFYGILVYLLWVNVRNVRLRIFLCFLLVVWELVIAYSRVYLNVHYATDVIAGLSAGVFWCMFTVILVRQLEQYFHFRERKRRLSQIRKERNSRSQ